jgi:crotonobetainyl-CoA:carnitine CoA-transferase CaiB-like acyl-CoA transferase
MLLAALGADVIKIESSRRLDPTRGRENRPYLHSIIFDDVNQGKRSIAIDLKHPDGIALALDIIEHSDVVMDNFRPGVMDAWGLTFDALIARKSQLVVASLSAVGGYGHLAKLPGYAGIFNAFSGLGDLTGYAEGPPTELRTSVDLRSGAFFAFSIVAGLLEARVNGAGVRIDFSASESITSLLGEHLTALALGQAIAHRHGDDDEQYSPQGVFRCSDDKWVCVAVRDHSDWISLAAKIELELEDGNERAEELAHWIAQHASSDVSEMLADTGVPFGFVLDAVDIFAFPQHAHRSYFVDAVAPDGSRRTLAAVPFTFGGVRPEPSLGPVLGADTRIILDDVLGLDDDEVARLYDMDVLK